MSIPLFDHSTHILVPLLKAGCCDEIVSSMIQLMRRFPQYPRYLLNLRLGSCPIALVNGITDSREVRLVVARPSLWGEDYMLELIAAGEL